ncbi:alpha/beta fold hydrolase [Thalassoglobus polymorphus]|uniref:Haloalkane dehalogenase n=1 Tax=Thalassoglobus polymorphus TaxID=2527994 RepID=A0A517QM47_9PLAN|nr:alpha/beta fold hydrolase [Thalassoglobus polymorphus]QDT32627.1 Haloalkane dehalogenase [Thalassoglobus polymorphus]
MTRLPDSLREEYPFDPKSTEIDGHRYSYIDEGTGSPILMVHGNPSWSFAWRNFIKHFSANHRCLAVDHLGMGLSDKPQDYAYTIEQHISNLCSLIERLDLQSVTLVGHDWGGCIGMGAAGRMPERFSRFVMMNTAAFRSQEIPFRIALCRIPMLGAVGVRGFNLFAGAAVLQAIEKKDRMTDTIKKGYLFPYDNWANRIAVHRFVQEIPLKESHSTYKTLVDVEAGLSQFADHPFLLPWGEKDWCFTTNFLDDWEKRFPKADVLRIPDAGHYVFEDAHEVILPSMEEFFSSHPLSGAKSDTPST